MVFYSNFVIIKCETLIETPRTILLIDNNSNSIKPPTVRSSNRCSINSWVGRLCMTYGLVVWVLDLLCWMRHLSDCAFRIREDGEKGRLRVGLYWTFCLCGEIWVGSLCESRDLAEAKSNQLFWGLTSPISQRVVACPPLGFRLRGKLAEAKQSRWKISVRRAGRCSSAVLMISFLRCSTLPTRK